MGGLGSGGHNQKSRRRHRLQGTYRADRHGGGEGLLTVGAPQKSPPRYLDARGRWFWRQHAPVCEELGTLDAGSAQLFGTLCSEWSAWRRTTEQLDLEGWVIADTRGDKKPHPLANICHRHARRLVELADAFGLTPVGRKRLGIEAEKSTAPKIDNPFLTF